MLQPSGAGAAPQPASVLSTSDSKTTGQVVRGVRRNWLPYALAVPILAYEIVFILYPITQGIASSFTRTDVGRPVTFVGVANYQRMLTDPSFWIVVVHTLVYMLCVIGVSIGGGLASALLFNRRFVGRVLARGLLTLPWSFPDVPTVLVFVWILNPQFGVMNVFARLLPWVQQNQRWLLDARLAMVSIVLISAWKAFPFYSLVLLAALQSVPSERYEAARVDGANALQLFRHIIIPGITPTLLLLVVLAAIFSFKQFTIIYLLTGGGPAGSTETLVVRIYNTAFRFYDFSYSATLGVAGFLMAMSIVLLFMAAQKHQDEAELGY
jgi:multiple sugar transport system permease protein